MFKVADIRNHFINELKLKKFTIDKTGARTIEMIGASFIADEEAIFGEPNFEYIDHELDWYNDMSTNIMTYMDQVKHHLKLGKCLQMKKVRSIQTMVF